MTVPCDKGPLLEEFQKALIENGMKIKGVNDAVINLTSQFTQCITELRGMYGDDREYQTRILRVERDVEVLFSQQRKIELLISDKMDKLEKTLVDRIDPVITWKNRVEGGWWLIKAIPIAGAVISVLAALVATGAFK